MAGTYHDRLEGRLGSPEAAPRALAEHALAQMPFWVKAATRLRDRLVKPLGLKTAESLPRDASLLDALTTDRDDAEVFSTGLDDRHLDFRVTLIKETGGRFALATRIEPHNALGRAYLCAVLPAHRIIMRGLASTLSRPIGESRP